MKNNLFNVYIVSKLAVKSQRLLVRYHDFLLLFMFVLSGIVGLRIHS